MTTLSGQRVLVIGGSSGIGAATARLAAEQGAAVTIASRSAAKLSTAAEHIGNGVIARQLDTTDEANVAAFFAQEEAFDHIVISAAQTKTGPMKDLALNDAQASMNSKFWGAYRVARAAELRAGGSLTFVTGFLSVRPKKGAVLQGAINAALEALAKGLAIELAPVRVNAVSPGVVATELYGGMASDARTAMYQRAAAHLPAGLVGQPVHIAGQILAFINNPYATGSIAYIDGGGSVA
jgi:NAD(P)-dependent dehydrogenase (short-subunit alcohol dehydrogenase family)